MIPIKTAFTKGLRLLDGADYAASGAIAPRSHHAKLDAGDGALAMTLAAPGADLIGSFLFITLEDAANAATVQIPQAGGNVTRTLSTLGDCLLLCAFDDALWLVVAFNKAATALTSVTLVNDSGGTPATTIAEITDTGGAADVAPVANAIASLATQLNALRVDVVALKAKE